MDVASGAEVVRRFYAAVAGRDATGLGKVVDEAFAADVVLALPPSLPYGGEIGGAERLRRMFTAMAASPVPVGPSGVTVTDLVDGGDRVVAVLAFDWFAPGSAGPPLPMSAVEVWTFTGGLVSGIRAFYWDTAACVAAVPATT